MKRLGLILILLLSALTLLAQTEDWLWARKAGGTNSDAGQDVAVDGTGNSYVTGRFYGSATFGSETLISHGSNDIFVTKLDPNGNYLWTRQAGGASVDEGWGITTDTNGNCLVTGQISGTVSFGSITLNGDSPSMFVAKLDGSGNWLWARITNRQGVSPGSARGRDVTTDLLGNCYVTGDCNGYVYFGSTLIYAFTDLFVTKLDPNGNWLWAKKAEGVGSDSGTSISTDASGNSYVTGYFSDSAYFGSISISSGGSHDVFVVKLDTSGNWIWARRAGGTSADAGTGIAVSSNGNSYLTGHFQGTASFGGSSLTSNGNEDIFIAKLDSAGNWLWARKAGGVSVDHGRSIALDNSGNSFVTGYIGGSATFGASSLSGGGLFVTKISSSGDWLWAKQAFGQGGGNGISTNGNGYCIITGSFENSVSFGGVTLLPNGDQDVLTAKFGQPIYEVLTPNGGEHWQAGGDQSVYWRIDHSDPGINILLSINNGASWIMLNSVPIQSALGRYAFTAPFANSAQCLIKVESATNNSYYDVSNAVFSISSSPPATLLLSPPTNAKLQAAKSYAVEWQASGVSFIHLDYSVDAGLSWTRIASSLPASAGSYVWTVPQTPASICYLKVSDAVNPARYDWSDEPFTICSLQLIAPDGGDILQAGAQTAIIWMSEQIASVSLAFSSDSGLQWIPIATGVSALSGSYVWTLPSLASDQYLVRISDADDIEVNDTSDTPFTVASLVVAYPSTPGIKLQVGMTYDISWHSGFLPGTVKLELTTNGTDYTTIGTGLGAASGNYLWTVPDSPSTICKIRVSSELDTQIADLSDNSFTISRLSLLSPNGNEAWSSQTQHPITWNSVNVSDLKLEYSIDAGDTWHLIAASVPAASGSYVWTLPIINSTLCRVRITDAATATVFDVSESNFTIRPQIILTAPNGNEYLTVFSIYSIQWSSTAEVSFVAIEYSVNNGTSWLPIQSSAYPASVGTYDWIVPNNPSETCMVRIRRFDDATVFDVSDAAFTITPVIHPPSVDFSAEPTGGLQFLNVQFTDLSTPGTGSIVSRLWDFGNGDESTEQHPLYIYQEPGLYSVTLTVTNSASLNATLTQVDYINVLPRFPEIATTPANNINFGNVYLGSQSQPVPLLIRNTGTADLIVNAISFGIVSSPFALFERSLPMTIAEGDSAILSLVFTPQMAGIVSDSLYVHSNATIYPVYAIGLRGSGEYVPPRPPEGLAVIMDGSNALLSWDAVTETIFDTPIVPDYYLVFYNGSSNPEGLFYFHGATASLNYTHFLVGLHAQHMFYRVRAYKHYGRERYRMEDFDELESLTETEVLRILQDL